MDVREPGALDAALDLVAFRATPPDHDVQIGPVAQELGRVEQGVEPVAEEQPAHGQRDERVGRQTEAGADPGARGALDRREALHVGAEVHDGDIASRREPAHVVGGELADRDETIGRAHGVARDRRVGDALHEVEREPVLDVGVVLDQHERLVVHARRARAAAIVLMNVCVCAVTTSTSRREVLRHREQLRRVQRVRQPDAVFEHVARRDLVHREAVVERQRAVVGDARRHDGQLVAARDETPRLLTRLELDPTHVRRPVVRRREDAH